MSIIDWTNFILFYSGGASAMLGITISSMLRADRSGLDWKDLLLVILWPVIITNSIIKTL